LELGVDVRVGVRVEVKTGVGVGVSIKLDSLIAPSGIGIVTSRSLAISVVSLLRVSVTVKMSPTLTVWGVTFICRLRLGRCGSVPGVSVSCGCEGCDTPEAPGEGLFVELVVSGALEVEEPTSVGIAALAGAAG
jgi:hypothetical protein